MIFTLVEIGLGFSSVFGGVRKSVVFSLTIIESFRFEDENKYECEIFARVLK